MLAKIKQSGLATFSLRLTGGYDFECEEIVRCVPSRRLVCRGKLDGQSVHAKLFIGKTAKRHAARDLRGVQALDSAGILTPSTLFVGAIEEGLGEALIFITVPNSVNAEQALESFEIKANRVALAKRLAVEVAGHHEAGLIQKDLYLKNFLLQGAEVYTLDGDAIRKLPVICGRHRALGNLSLLLSKFDVSDMADCLPELLDSYTKARGWSAAPDVAVMKKCISAQRCGMVRHYVEEKVFRQCSDVEVKKDFSRYLAIARPHLSEALKQALKDPGKLLDEPNVRLKSGNTCTVSLAEIGGRKIVIKRYNIKDFWHGLNRAFRRSRAAISWANAHRLRMYGIATAAPIALLEKRCGMIRRQAYFLSEYVDAPDVAEFFTNPKISTAQKNQLAERIATLFYKLYLLKITHGDCKAGNMKIVAGEPLLLDLDSMYEHRCAHLFPKRHVRDLRRFMRNWQHDSEASNRLTAAFQAIYKNTLLLDKAGMATTQNGAT